MNYPACTLHIPSFSSSSFSILLDSSCIQLTSCLFYLQYIYFYLMIILLFLVLFLYKYISCIILDWSLSILLYSISLSRNINYHTMYLILSILLLLFSNTLSLFYCLYLQVYLCYFSLIQVSMIRLIYRYSSLTLSHSHSHYYTSKCEFLLSIDTPHSLSHSLLYK